MFNDRKDAAIQLSKALEKYKDSGAIVLGIPRGGAETAYYVALNLNADYSLLIARKLGHPNNPEYAVGAISEDGSIYLNPDASAEVSEEILQDEIEHQKEEIRRRIKILRNGEALPALTGRTVILVDDGIATGATLYAAIETCKNQQASRIIVAAPVSAREKLIELRSMVDDVVVLETPVFYQAVSQAYRTFYNLTDQEALRFYEKWKQEKHGSQRGG